MDWQYYTLLVAGRSRTGINPKPERYKYPYPDFVQLIYTAHAKRFTPEAKLIGDYEIESNFCPLDEVKGLNLSMSDCFFLDAALKVC